MRHLMICLLLLLIALQAFAAPAFTRPTLNGMRLPDGAITIDGRDEDWLRIDTPLGYQITTDSAKRWTFTYPERGVRTDADDASFTVTLATDSANFYLLVDVHDQVLINDATADTPFFGDDFEIFIDANPPEARFVKTNENVRQLIFLPAYLNPAFTKPLLWQAEQNPGVVAAGRFRPWGYTLEVKVPKALFPYWKEHPEMNSIGFEAGINDADASGVDAIHPAIKGALFLSTAETHFLGPQKLSTLQFGETVVKQRPRLATRRTSVDMLLRRLRQPITDQNELDLAQQTLDYLTDARAAEVAEAAVAVENDTIRKAGLLLLAKRPELPAPVTALQTIAIAPANAEGVLETPDLRSYALIALAQRKQLPAMKVFNLYGNYMTDPALRLTAVWALGINGDKVVTPQLIPLLTDKNLRVRMMAAMALGNLQDEAAVRPLMTMMTADRHQYARIQAEQALRELQKRGCPMPADLKWPETK